MKVSYKGKLDALTPPLRKKWDAKLEKLGKLADGRGEREAHVILSAERHIQQAEITLNLRDHSLIGVGSSPDLLTAMTTAVDKLLKQIQKVKGKRRDTKRKPEETVRKAAVPEPAASSAPAPEPAAPRKVYRANRRANQKPLTLEEAMIAIEDHRDYVVYRDSETGKLSVLLRRRDGHFDLVES